MIMIIQNMKRNKEKNTTEKPRVTSCVIFTLPLQAAFGVLGLPTRTSHKDSFLESPSLSQRPGATVQPSGKGPKASRLSQTSFLIRLQT